MKDWVLPYTAGIIDGEGNIRISRDFRRWGFIGIYVTNTNEWLVRWLKMQYGGNVSSTDAHKSNWKRPYRWRITHRKALNLLVSLLPYLQIKRPHAELAIAYQRRRYIGRNQYSDEDRVLDDLQHNQLSKLNERGFKPA